MRLKGIPDLLWIDNVVTEPTAFDGLLPFLYFKIIKTAPVKATKTTSADVEMIHIVLVSIFGCLVATYALKGISCPELTPVGGKAGSPVYKFFRQHRKKNNEHRSRKGM